LVTVLLNANFSNASHLRQQEHRSNVTAGVYLHPQNFAQAVSEKMTNCQEDQ